MIVNYHITWDKARGQWKLQAVGAAPVGFYASQGMARDIAISLRAAAGGAGRITVHNKAGRFTDLSC